MFSEKNDTNEVIGKSKLNMHHKAMMNEMYSQRAQEYADAIKANIYNTLYDRPSLLALIESEKFDSCLDMGSGPGAYIAELKKFCHKITAIDQSNEFIEIITSTFPDVESYVCDLNNGLPKEEDSKFDLVISPLTIHYIADFDALFKEVFRVLKKNGVFVFSTHHPIVDFNDSESGNYFEKEKLCQMWDTLGDKKTEVSFYRRPLSETFNALLNAGFIIDGYSEGKPSEKIKEISEVIYERLCTKPQFIFVRARKVLSN